MALLTMQVAIVLSQADQQSFRDYRDCVTQQINNADLAGKDSEIIRNAQKACEDDRFAAAMEMAADDVEHEVVGKKLPAGVDVRMSLMENELKADVLSGLVDRRMKAK